MTPHRNGEMLFGSKHNQLCFIRINLDLIVRHPTFDILHTVIELFEGSISIPFSKMNIKLGVISINMKHNKFMHADDSTQMTCIQR